ncbi:MAG TPA: M6 family metalloprotease domain-containing protein [Methylomirabilota bacterium]|nr:M6 family metalloprotease domain-containing protein [Methylomirabilota bacterium]
MKTSLPFALIHRTLFAPMLITALLWSAPRINAINASGQLVEVRQPDGREITVRARGDEFCHWYEDADGFAVVLNQGQYRYATVDAKGALAASPLLVGRDDPRAAGLPKNARPSAEFISAEREKFLAPMHAFAPGPNIAPVGTVKNLVILCRFSDHTLGVHTRAPADYDVIFNTAGGDAVLAPTGSVKDYYREASYGTLILNSTVIAWVTLPQTEAYYGNGTSGLQGSYPANAQGMVRDALNAADPLVNFGQFDSDNDGFVDAITIIHSGYAAETGGGNGNWMWSHRWSLFALPGGRWTSGDVNGNGANVKVYDYHTEAALWSTSGTGIARIGVIAHETGHFFGLPDLYDTDSSSAGIGSYCLMANSWGFDQTQRNPPHPSAWCKIQLGWVTPVNITPGIHNVPRAESVALAYRIPTGFPSGEYLLIENRQPTGFESIMPQGGLTIWHIDENKADNKSEGFPGQAGWPGNANHYKVALLQADGSYHLEHNVNRGDAGDVFHGGGVSSIGPATSPNTGRYQGGTIATTGIQISGISASASNMTFTFSIVGAGNAPAITGFTPGSGGAGASVTISGTNFTGATSVRFNGVTASFTVNSGVQISATVPAAATTGPISVMTPNGTAVSAGNFVITTAVPNDNFAGAQTLTGTNGTVNGGNTGATKEPGEPNHVGNTGGASVWYQWTALASGAATIDTEGSSFDTTLAVYTGSSVNALSTIASDDDSGTGQLSLLTFNAVAGTTYRIAVDGFNEGAGAASGAITLHWSGQPVLGSLNDNFAAARVLTGASGSVLDNNGTATKEAGEPNHVGNTGGKSLWYRWTAPASGVATFDTAGSSFDTLLAAYSGAAVNSLSFLAANDDVNGGVQSLISFTATAGAVYRIAVDGYNGASGGIFLNWVISSTAPAVFGFTPGSGSVGTLVTLSGTNFTGVTAVRFNGTIAAYAVNSQTQIVATVPGGASTGPISVTTGNGTAVSALNFNVTGGVANDNFASASVLSGSSGAISGANFDATIEGPEPFHAGNEGGASVWYRWTAPSSGPAIVDTLGSNFDTLLGVYTGGTLNSLLLVGADDDTATNQQSAVAFTASAGATYSIAVDGFNDGFEIEVGSITLHWSLLANNDAFASANLLTGVNVITNGNTAGATKQPGEPNHAGDFGGHSIWFRWIAPTNGSVIISTLGSSFDTLLGVYTGASVASLATVAANDDFTGLTSQVNFNAVNGTTYLIAVDGYGGASGGVVLNLFVMPKVQIRQTANAVVFGWPTNYPGYTLQSALSVTETSVWSNVTPLPVNIGGSFTVTNSVGVGQKFFRLSK